jgi:ATP synthase protein I
MGRLKNLAKNSPAAARSSAVQSYGEVATLGLSFMFSLVIGVGLGWWLDNKFGWNPYGVLGGLAIGLAAGVRSAYVILKPAISRPASSSSSAAPPDSQTYDDRP